MQGERPAKSTLPTTKVATTTTIVAPKKQTTTTITDAIPKAQLLNRKRPSSEDAVLAELPKAHRRSVDVKKVM